MYTLKPVIDLPERIPLPNVMYQLPRIQGGAAVNEEYDCQVNELGHHVLEARQVNILKQLYELKEQVEHLCIAVRLSEVNKASDSGITTTILNNQKPIFVEMIVSANPASPPYSILALQRIWKNTKFNVQVHRHSSINGTATNDFEEKLLSNSGNEAIHIIDLKLIWKDVSDVQLTTKPYDYPLKGEANVLRFLTRLIQNYNYEQTKSLEEANIIDTILDLCLRLNYEEPRFINAIVAKFASYLDKNPWLTNSTEPTITDIAVWSIIRRLTRHKVPGNLKNWFDLCEKTFLAV